MIRNNVYNEMCMDTMYRRSLLMTENFKNAQLVQDRAREAYKKLSNFKEQILFFKQILEDLRYYHQKKKMLFSVDLFRKCEFLLVKRCYIIAKDLHQILLFGTHAQGNIMIPKDEFSDLIDETKVTNNYNRILREEVGRLYEEFKNDWQNTKECFYEHQRRNGIRIIPREDAYLENLVENKNLILAFNDCFLELFMELSKGIVDTYAHRLSEPIIVSSIVLNHGVNISFVYDLMIVLCFPQISETGNMKAYKERKKHVPCQEFIYRAQIAYNHWKGAYESLCSMYPPDNPI